MTIIDIIDIKNIRYIFFAICFMFDSLVIVYFSIYLDASVEERAKRRFQENQEKGIRTSYEEVLDKV